MPNRLIREGIVDSKRINRLVRDAGWFGEVFYRKLLNVVDDYGRYTADPEILRPKLFPRQLDMVREADCVRLLAACEKADLVRCYAVNGEALLVVLDFGQQIRAKASKFEAPPPDIECQMRSTCYAHDAHMRTKTKTETKTKTKAQTKAQTSLSLSSDSKTRKPDGNSCPPREREREIELTSEQIDEVRL